MRIFLVILFSAFLVGCKTLQDSNAYNFKGVQIQNRSNGICPNSLEGSALIGSNGMRAWISLPEHSITLNLWSDDVQDSVIKSGQGSGQYITSVSFFLVKNEHYWVGATSIIATEDRANGVCRYKIFAYKDKDKNVREEVLISGLSKRFNQESININDFSALEDFSVKNKKNIDYVLGAIDSYSLSDAERALFLKQFKNELN